jgi:hypothetical protein
MDGSDIHVVDDRVQMSPNGYTSACYDDVAWDPQTTDMTTAAASAGVLHLGSDESQTVDFGLAPKPFATLSGTVTATNGDPLTGVDVEAFSVGQPPTPTNSNQADTDADGRFSFNLAVGTYKLCFWAGRSVVGSPGVPSVTGGPSQGGYESQCYDGVSGPDKISWDTDALVSAATTIAVGTSGTITVNPQLASLATLAGTVEDPSGNPVGGSVLWLYQDGIRLASTFASTLDGTFSFTRIAPGTYTLCLVPQSNDAKAFGAQNRCYNGVVLSSESVAPSSAEAQQGTPIAVAPGEKQNLVLTLTPEQ